MEPNEWVALLRSDVLDHLINDFPDIIIFKDGEGKWMMANDHALGLFRINGTNYKGKTDHEFALENPQFKETLFECIGSDQKAWEMKQKIRIEETVVHPDGSTRIFDVIKSPLFFDNGDRKSLLVIGRDITDKRKAEEQIRKTYKNLKNIKFALDQSSKLVVTDRAGFITNVNDAFCKISQYTEEELIGRNIRLLNSGYHSKEFYKELWDTVSQGRVWFGEVRNKAKDGSFYWVETTIVPFLDDQGMPYEYVSIRHDITKKVEALSQVKKLALHDELTGLPNRRMFKQILKEKIESTKDKIGILFIDLNRFKQINDLMGHVIGDQVLKHWSQQIQKLMGENEWIFRIGGDEFTVLAEVESEEQLIHLAERIIQNASEPIYLQDSNLHVGVSIGMALYPNHGEDVDTLMNRADTAMYIAKHQGSGFYELYHPIMDSNRLFKIKISNDLYGAIERGEIYLHYQPQIDMVNKKINGVEALARWSHPKLGTISPADFIMSAEENGLIIKFGEWIIEQACTQLKEWHQSLDPNLTMAINISAKQFKQKDFVHRISEIIRTTGVSPKHLELELTESLCMLDTELTFETLKELKELGVQICIDDFGTGYSSLSYLMQFSIDKLKIDQSFIRNISRRENASIVSTIIAMAHDLNLTVMAEGLENEEQMNFLLKNNCFEAQGYYFSTPIDVNDFKDYYRNFQFSICK